MVSLRRRIASVAIAWLCCHALALAAPLGAAAIAATEDLCTCPGGTPGAVCPMHHRVTAPDASSVPPGTHVRNGCVQADYTLSALAVGHGVLPQTSAPAVDIAATSVVVLALSPLRRASVPDAPPPRA